MCSVCGKDIEGERPVSSIRGTDQVYHVGCAPEELVRDALAEWDAIVKKGVKYFVRKYLSNESNLSSLSTTDASQDDSTAHNRLFTEFGDVLRDEIERRKNQSGSKS